MSAKCNRYVQKFERTKDENIDRESERQREGESESESENKVRFLTKNECTFDKSKETYNF